MLTHDAASLDQRIEHLSKIRSALVLVLGEIDAELIPLKKTRNARQSPIGRLPIELLVRILRLSQISDSGALSIHNVVPHASWWKVMSVSTHFRSVIVSSPTLWAAFDSGWPRKWYQLCTKRAGRCLLNVSIQVISKLHAGVACRLLPRSEHAVVNFSPNTGTTGWDESYIPDTPSQMPGFAVSEAPRRLAAYFTSAFASAAHIMHRLIISRRELEVDHSRRHVQLPSQSETASHL
jgi:hypothetical protein